MGSLPTRAVTRHDVVKAQGAHLLESSRYDRLHDGTCQMAAPNEGVELLYPGQALSIPEHIDDSRMAATGHYHKALPLDLDDDALIIPDHEVGLPAMTTAAVLDREAGFEVGLPFDLARDQHAAVDQQRRASLLNHLDVLIFQVGNAGWWSRDLKPIREDDLAFEPGIGVQHQRHGSAADSRNHARQAAVMVGVAV